MKNEIKTTAASSKRKKMIGNNSPVQETLRSNQPLANLSNIKEIETSITKGMMDIDHIDTHLPINNRGRRLDFQDEGLHRNRVPQVSTPIDSQIEEDVMEDEETREISRNIIIGSYNAMNDIFN